ncbi:glycosyltransferase family 87 protein [Rhodoplanes roseus]|nr:glycosyltransferase family 87 protein [Rhodoplanes roseus]
MGLAARVASGDWLTRERVRLWALALLGFSTLALVAVAVTSNGWTDWQGRPLGTDFSCFWTAGLLVLDGHPARAFDNEALFALQRATFGPETPFYGWLYPPFFLLVAGLLATLPYPVALGLWLAVTVGLYVWAMRAILRGADGGTTGQGAWRPTSTLDPMWLLLVLAFPGVFVTLGHGQNGFLTAALFGGALAILDRRPLLAGVLLGLLVYKPQFGPLIPLALLAGGRWRTVAAAGTTVLALFGVTLALLGPEPWQAFLAGLGGTRAEVLEQGSAGWHKLHGVFAWTRLWGGSTGLAYGLHAIVALATAGAVVWAWRAPVRPPLRAALLLIGALAVAPHSHDYDLMLLAPAMAFLITDGVRHGFARGEKSLLALVFVMPLFTRAVAEHMLVPVGTLVTLALLITTVRRCSMTLGPVAAHGSATRPETLETPAPT